ncbi:MAG: ABC transporter permease [Kibdelosporangium sp.]
MTLLAAERIKLFSTRSPWWCFAAAIALTVGFGGLVTANPGPEGIVTVEVTQVGYGFGLAVILVMAALSVTTEYRFNTIKTTFQAVPGRTSALLAKTAVVALTSAVVGLVAAFGSLGIGKLLQPSADLALDSQADWRAVAGVGLVFAITAVIAIGVGVLIRQTAGAVALLLAYVLMVEELVLLIPNVGDDIQKWLPFQLAGRFLGDGNGPGVNPWAALGVFAAFAAVLLTIAVVTARKRDA